MSLPVDAAANLFERGESAASVRAVGRNTPALRAPPTASCCGAEAGGG